MRPPRVPLQGTPPSGAQAGLHQLPVLDGGLQAQIWLSSCGPCCPPHPDVSCWRTFLLERDAAWHQAQAQNVPTQPRLSLCCNLFSQHISSAGLRGPRDGARFSSARSWAARNPGVRQEKRLGVTHRGPRGAVCWRPSDRSHSDVKSPLH